MILRVDSKLRLIGLSPEEADRLSQVYSLKNPKYAAAIKYGNVHPAYVTIPEYIRMAEFSGGVMSLPRGLTLEEEGLGQDLRLKLKSAHVNDSRLVVPIEEPYPECLITPTGEQQKVLDEFELELGSGRPERPYGTYLHVLEVAAGKTIMAAKMAMRLGQKTIVLVHTQLIMNAWISDLCKMFGPDYKKEIGIIQGPKATVGPHFTICMLQTWFRRKDKWGFWQTEFGTCVMDECFVAGTKIATPQGERNIEDICVGDMVWSQLGKKVVARKVCRLYNRYPSELLRVTLNNGRTVTCTPNHKFFGADNAQIRADQLKIGTLLRELPEKVGGAESFGGMPRLQVQKISDAVPILSNMPSSSAKEICCGAHRNSSQSASSRRRNKISHRPEKAPEHNKNASDWIHAESRQDCESVFRKTSRQESQNLVQRSSRETSKDNAKIISTRAYKDRLGDYHEARSDVPSDVSSSSSRISDNQSEVPDRLFLGTNQDRNRSGWAKPQEAASNKTRSTENNVVPEAQDQNNSIFSQGSGVIVQKVERTSILRPVFNLEVEETHNYFAEGVLVSNCHLCPCNSFTDCVSNFPAKYRIGITGTPYRRDKMHPLMFAVFGRPFYKMKSKGLETETSLPVDKVFEVQVDTPLTVTEPKVKTYRDEYGHLRFEDQSSSVDENRDYAVILNALAANPYRNKRIAFKVKLALENDPNNVVLVVTHRKKHARLLKDSIEDATGMEVALFISDVGRDIIREQEEKLKNREIRIVVATIQLIKTGASIPSLNRLFITTPIGSRQDLEQLIGRIRRKCPGKKNARIYHFVDHNIGLCKRHYFRHAVPFYREILKVPSFRGKFIS